MLNSKTSKNCDIRRINDQEGSISEPRDIANKFNDYYVNVGPALAPKIKLSSHNLNNKNNKTTPKESMFLHPTTEDEILDIIKSLK